MTAVARVELIVPGPLLTIGGIVLAARGHEAMPPPYSLSVCRFVEHTGEPWPTSFGYTDLRTALDGLMLAGLVALRSAITHIDLRTNASHTDIHTILRLTSHPIREDRPCP